MPTDDPPDTTANAQPDRAAYDVPAAVTAHTCAYCGQPFASEDLLVLHRGQAHADAIGDDELADFEAAFEAESDELRLFRLKAVGALIVLYFGLLMVYALAT